MNQSEKDVFTGERFVPGIDDSKLEIEHFQRYHSIKEIVRDKVVVDAACGEGYGTSILSETAKKITGIDIDAGAVNRAINKYKTEKIDYLVGDVTKLPLENDSVDVFISFETIEHIPEEAQKLFLNEISRVLKPEGVLIMSTPNKTIYSDKYNYDNEYHVKEFYKDEFVSFLMGKFKNVNLFNQYFEVTGVIDSNELYSENSLFFKNRETYDVDGKYFLGVASNEDISNIVINSFYINNYPEYDKNIERIIELQNDVEERNAHIKRLDKNIEMKNQLIAQLEKHINDKDVHINNLEKRCRVISKIPGAKILKYIYRKLKKVKKIIGKVKDIPIYLKLTFKKKENPKVTIVIPVYNQFIYTYRCLKSILKYSTDVDYEIIVADDVSKDKTRKLEKYATGISIIHNKENLKFLLNCNNAAKYAEGEYILFLNNDTQVTEGWLSSLVNLIESDEKIGMVGSKLIYPDGILQEAGGIIWRDASGWNYGRNMDASLPEYNYVREVDYISGAAIMIKKPLWQEIGGFDELFAPAYCEDSDLAFQVRQKGYKVMYQPDSVVIHFEGVSNGTDLNSGLKKYQVENSLKFKEKWGKELENQFDNSQNVFRARERNHNKKTILFIDHYVPTFDKDAGSRTTFQYIKMFIKKGYIVKFIGDNFHCEQPYTKALEQLGVEVLYGDWYRKNIFEWIEDNQKSIDFAYLNRPHIASKYIDFIKKNTGIKCIFYGHDLHFLRLEREAELTQDSKKFHEAEMNKSQEFEIMKKADMSYYPSYIEKDAINEIDSSINVKAITAYVFEEFKSNFEYLTDGREGLLFVGGFSHVPNVDAIKWFKEEIYPLIKGKQDINLYIVGSNAPNEVVEMNGNGIIFKGFVSDEELCELYEKCRIVIVPLRYGAGVKGKVVEAIYNGMPIVTTGIGAEGLVGVEEVLKIADEPDKFAYEVLNLYNDEKELKNMSERTQKYIKDNFSIEAVWDIIKEDFN